MISSIPQRSLFTLTSPKTGKKGTLGSFQICSSTGVCFIRVDAMLASGFPMSSNSYKIAFFPLQKESPSSGCENGQSVSGGSRAPQKALGRAAAVWPRWLFVHHSWGWNDHTG